jgi:NAD(P)-dependent dehydrogenase (short-subunit alcohol dehydrogenase family)
VSETERNWLITGCSTGIGRALAGLLAARGQKVFVTARDPGTLRDIANSHKHVTVLKLDVTSSEEIRAAVEAVERAGGVDVLVNNAGYGYLAAFEEADEASYRAQFETNVFGLIAMTKAVLPAMRQREAGHIVNIASVGGLVGNPGSAFYAATKFSVVGLSEALSREVGPLGVKITVVEPGPFRTDWAGRSLQGTSNRIAAYAATVHQRLDGLARNNGRECGDPARAAEAILSIVDHPDPPLNLVLGRVGLEVVREKLASLTAEIDAWEQLTLSADYPDAVLASDGAR